MCGLAVIKYLSWKGCRFKTHFLHNKIICRKYKKKYQLIYGIIVTASVVMTSGVVFEIEPVLLKVVGLNPSCMMLFFTVSPHF